MKRAGYIATGAAAIAAIAAPTFIGIPTRIVWNASPSVPIGFYTITPARDLRLGDLVTVEPPASLSGYMVARGYIGPGVPMVKPVTALPGQSVCRTGVRIAVDGVAIGDALPRDRMGRVLPVWQGCRRIEPDQIFLMNPSVRDSLDGRYFGPLPRASVTGKATPLYIDASGNGRFVWRSTTH